QPALLLLVAAIQRQDLGVAGVGSLVAEDRRRPHAGALDLVHQAELDLAVALATVLRREMRGLQALRLDLVLERADEAGEAFEVGVDDLERPDLLLNEALHPV